MYTTTTNADAATKTPADTTAPAAAPSRAIFVLGGPGCGKGTCCSRLAEELGWRHVSLGELIAEEARTDSAEARQISESIKAGTVVPQSVTIALLQARQTLLGSWDAFQGALPETRMRLAAC